MYVQLRLLHSISEENTALVNHLLKVLAIPLSFPKAGASKIRTCSLIRIWVHCALNEIPFRICSWRFSQYSSVRIPFSSSLLLPNQSCSLDQPSEYLAMVFRKIPKQPCCSRLMDRQSRGLKWSRLSVLDLFYINKIDKVVDTGLSSSQSFGFSFLRTHNIILKFSDFPQLLP